MNLILDVDGVILDWQAAFVKWVYQAHDLGLDPAGPNSYDLTGWAGTEAMSLVHQFSSTPGFGEIPYTSGTLTFFEDFQRLGLPHSIKLITSCGVEDCTVNARRKNLSAIDLFVSEYHFLPLGAPKKEKLAACSPGSVLVEDNVNHALDAVNLGMTAFVFKRSHNHRDLGIDPRLIWIDSWKPVLNTLCNLTKAT
jgi:hypothetical protein